MACHDPSVVKDGSINFRDKSHLIKKFRKLPVRLFKKSNNGVARLELYYSQKEYKIGSYSFLIPGSEVVSVKESNKQPFSEEKHCFIIATKDDQHYFSTTSEIDRKEWLEKTISSLLPSCGNSCSPSLNNNEREVTIENDIYESAGDFSKEYRVTAGAMTRQKLGVDGDVRLLIENGHITLITLQGVRIARWAIEHLRRFGYHESDFHIEAGRKSEHGEGTYSFVTSQGKQIHALVTKEKKICRENSAYKLIGAKPNILPGQMVSAHVNNNEIPFTTGCHIYEEAPISVVEKTVPSKPTRNPPPPRPTLNGSEVSPFNKDSSKGAKPSAAGADGGGPPIPISTFTPVKSQPTHGNRKTAITLGTPQPPSIYTEITPITNAWIDYGQDETEDSSSWNNNSKEGVYDSPEHLFKNTPPKDDVYANLNSKDVPPGKVYELRQQKQQQQQHDEGIQQSEPIYATVIKPNRRNKDLSNH